jgi:hypothetical protein
MKILFKISKWLHKYIGLVLLLFLMWMSISGVLMNHPELISGTGLFMRPPLLAAIATGKIPATRLRLLEGEQRLLDWK